MTDEEQGESTEQGEESSRERGELEAQVERLIEQLERLQESSRAWRSRLESGGRRTDRMLTRLRPLKGKVASLTPERLSEARETVEEGIICYQGLVNERPVSKWAVTAVAGALVLWVLLLAAVLVVNYTRRNRDPALDMVLYCICGGGLGGAAGALRDLIYFTGKRLYDRAWVSSYLLRPLLGAIMGVAAYALVRGGLLAASHGAGQGEGAASQGTQPATSTLGYYALAFVGGFAVEQMARKLLDIAETTFAVSEKSRRR